MALTPKLRFASNKPRSTSSKPRSALTRPLMLAVALASGAAGNAQASWYWPFANKTQSQAPTLSGEHEVKDLAYGDFLFDYFQQHYFASLTKLMIGEQKQQFKHNNDQAQVLKGALFVSFGMLEQAEQIFDQLLPSSVTRDDANKAWYTLADLHYRNGNAEHAHQILIEKIRDPSPALLPRVKLLDAQVLLQLERKDEAIKQLEGIKDDKEMGMWARYNLAACLASVDRSAEAAKIFRSILIMIPTDKETEALQDRAAFALGMNFFKQKKWDDAQTYLGLVRLDGQVAEPALLASGWIAINKKDKVGALTPWMALAERPASHPAVQEALLNIPYVYEDAGALRDALKAYHDAENTFITERGSIEDAKNIILQKDWIDRISPAPKLSDDPMGDLPAFEFSADASSQYLYQFFASNEFTESYRNYRELQRLNQVLNQWQEQIPTFRDTIASNLERLEKLLPAAQHKVEMAKTFRTNVNARERAISGEVDRILQTEDDFGTPDDAQLKIIERMKTLEQALAKLPTSEYGEEKAKFNLLKGVMAWDLSEKGPERRWQLVKDRAQLNNTLTELETVIQRVEHAREGQIERFRAQAERVKQLNTQLDTLKEASIQALARQRKYMQSIALNIMSEQQSRLDQLRGYSLLSIARLQDHAYSSNRKPVAPLAPAAITPEGVTTEPSIDPASAPRKPRGAKSLMDAIKGWL